MTKTPTSSPLWPAGYRLLSLGTVDSTNAEAMALALGGDEGRIWVSADEQVKGRGRSGRTWTSVRGNLYASLLLRLDCPPVIAQQLALVAGVAVVTAVRALLQPSGGQVRLKWPNDVLIGRAKLGGILVESSSGAGRAGLAAVIGIGLNVAAAPAGLGREATSLAAQGCASDRCSVLVAIAREMSRMLVAWDNGAGFEDVRAEWQAYAGPRGEPISVNTGAGAVNGRYLGLDGDGALLIEDDMGTTRRFTYGDVTLPGIGAH